MQDRRREVSLQLHGVEDGVKENLDLALDVHEDLEQVEDQAEELEAAGQLLQKRTHKVKSNMCCRACTTRMAKWGLILGLIAGVVVIIMIALGAGGVFSGGKK